MCKFVKAMSRVALIYSEIRASALLCLLKGSNIVLMLHQHECGMSHVNMARVVFVYTR